MKHFIIPPINELNLTYNSTAGFFCLAHLYKQSKKYRQFFLQKHVQQHFILLDNGAFEKQMLKDDDLIEICEELQPSEVVAPDSFMNFKQTVNRFLIFNQKLKLINNAPNILFVVQGNTANQWLKCFNFANQNCDINTIGIAKFFKDTKDENVTSNRQTLLNQLKFKLQKPIHLLGCSDPREVNAYTHPLIRSIDSCSSVLAAYHNINWNDNDFTRYRTTNEYHAYTLNIKQRIIAKLNAQYLQSQMNKTIKL